MNARKPGFEPLVERVTVTEAGILFRSRRSDGQAAQPARELVAILKARRAGWIEGHAVDAGTGEPVRLDRVVVFSFEREPNGAIVPLGRASELFEQTEPGQFRASISDPGEFRLTFTAAGYQDAEVHPPTVTELKFIEGIVVLMKKKAHGPAPAIVGRTITGTVTREGRPVRSGWVALWTLTKPMNVVNAPIMRGRTVVESPRIFAAPLRDGAYTLDVPFPRATWYVVVEEPGYPLTQVGPIPIALNEKKTLDIACTEGGRIRGRVKDAPPGWEGHLWVVAFSKTAVREETRVAPDGTFSLPRLPPGEYGLKVGHDAYEDAEVYPGRLFRDHPEAFKETADPWKARPRW